MNKKDQEALEKDPIAYVEKMEADHKTAVETLTAEHATAIETLATDHATAVETLTTDHATAIETLATDHETAVETLKNDHASVLEAKDAEIKALNEKLAISLKSDNLGMVPGRYKSESGKLYEFKKGFTQFSYKGHEYVSEQLIKEKNSEVLEDLIEIGFGGLIEIQKSK